MDKNPLNALRSIATHRFILIVIVIRNRRREKGWWWFWIWFWSLFYVSSQLFRYGEGGIEIVSCVRCESDGVSIRMDLMDHSVVLILEHWANIFRVGGERGRKNKGKSREFKSLYLNCRLLNSTDSTEYTIVDIGWKGGFKRTFFNYWWCHFRFMESQF